MRLWGIQWGFPLLLNADEPHSMNLAVSFGSGDLNPHLFKYPSLSLYLLFAVYGAAFVLWSGFGVLRSVAEFGHLYVWHPELFALLGRLLAATVSGAGLVCVARLARRPPEAGGSASLLPPLAAALLAVAPSLVASAHEVKPDSLMFCLSALAWWQALRVLEGAGRAAYVWAGVFAGMAFSTQFTALPILAALTLAHLLRHGKASLAGTAAVDLAAGLGATAGGFLLGTPYALLDHQAFFAGLRDHGVRAARGSLGLFPLGVPFRFAGELSLAGPALAAGAWRLARTEPKRLLLLALPFAAWAAAMTGHHDNANFRYYFACFPALALLSATGLAWLLEGARRLPAQALLVSAALAPGLWSSAAADRWLSLPDTRAVATRWIEENLPAGSAVLLDQAHASPNLRMLREQAEDLQRRTAELGSPRATYYRMMADSHPGGGYRLYRVKRTARDLVTNPSLLEKVQREGPFIDVSAGLEALRARGIRYVVTTSQGYVLDPSLSGLERFVSELEARGRVLARFEPEEGRSTGPSLRVYEVPEDTRKAR
ncbi:MAG: glycosyltransferase family 39 protein [Elusimicrobia bacterium]|nr:glycosyltransferase family 39 protein [Elusimicrobiota bacterium]